MHRNTILGFSTAVMVMGSAAISGCASVSTETSDQYAAEADWPVVYEPGYQAAQREKAQQSNFLQQPTGEERLLGVIQYGAGVVSMSKVSGANVAVKAMVAQIKDSQAQSAAYIVRGYAVNDKGVARAQQTAHWRAESLYYRLAKAGVPRSSMLIETRVVSAESGPEGRQAVLIRR